VTSSGAGFITWNAIAGSSPTAYTPTCTGTSGNISVDYANVTDTSWFIYTPCTVTMQNQWTGFKGQVYAGVLSQYPINSTMQMSMFTVPGITATSTGSSTPVATMLSRFSLAG
jgi:hypothetical protein